MSLPAEISLIREGFLKELREVKTSKDIEELKVKYLGKKGSIQNLMLYLKNCTAEERPLFGKFINDIKEEVSAHVENSLKRLISEEQDKQIEKEAIDVTLPGRRKSWGKDHPISQMASKMLNALVSMGFSIEEAPDLESDFYNFEALNFQPGHPAREMQDTFYVSDNLLLRTHTSNVQVRAMEKYKPPLRIASFGRCFRNENISARSHVLFHQVEFFYIDEKVSMADLLYTLEEFWSKVFDKKISARVRPSYFPFVEPGIEVDIDCFICNKKGCRICKQSGWLEVNGAGMIHPEVFKFGGIDPEKYSGFAVGLGVERAAMLFYGIKDIRAFTENDMRFLNQFPA